MASEQEEKERAAKGFKVEDRRRFSAEGELRPEHRGADETTKPPPPESGKTGRAGAAASSAAVTAGALAQAAGNASHGGESIAEITFAGFVVGLSTQALFHLGEIVDPQSAQPAPDLPAAQQLIDIIAMLKQKTRGNLDRDEQSMLDAILYEPE